VLVPASCYLEVAMVIAGRKGPDSRPEIDALLGRLRARLVPFVEEHARAAADAFLRYGKGRHPAGLNFGDCMAYAVAKAEGARLMFTGDDFAKTDVARWGA
jgi:ribonuclease VapC